MSPALHLISLNQFYYEKNSPAAERMTCFCLPFSTNKQGGEITTTATTATGGCRSTGSTTASATSADGS